MIDPYNLSFFRFNQMNQQTKGKESRRARDAYLDSFTVNRRFYLVLLIAYNRVGDRWKKEEQSRDLLSRQFLACHYEMDLSSPFFHVNIYFTYIDTCVSYSRDQI